MGLETLLQFIERLLTRRPPKVIAGTFFTSGMTVVLIGYLRGSAEVTMFLTILGGSGGLAHGNRASVGRETMP
jgi:hypothetical protein